MIPFGCDLDIFSYCVEQPRESWRASRRQLVSCLGERTEQQLQQPSHTPTITTDISLKVEDSLPQRNMIALNARLETVECGNHAGWSECFQDLQTWCPNAQDELNTPQVNLQDGFNFSTGCYQVKDEPSPVDVMDESWGNDLLFTIKNNNNVDEEVNNNNNNVQLSNTRLPDINYDYTALSMKSPLKSTEKGKIMLFQTRIDVCSELSPSDVSATAAIAPTTTFNLDETNTITATRNTFRTPSVTATMAAGGRREKPKLKLDISAASSSKVNSLSTPEVLKQLVDSTGGGGFDLVSYLDSENTGNDLEDDKQIAVPASEVATQDHDYDNSIRPSEPPVMLPVIKTEPPSPPPTTTSRAPRGRPIKRKKSDSQSDYVFDEDTGISDDSTDWSPSSSSTVSKSKRGRTKKAKVQAASKSPSSTYSTGRRSSRRDSDADSVMSAMSGTDKYRELRDKNNEASRRSRMNRKQRDGDMRRTAADLEKDNIMLKIKAERMENLVQELRATILKTLNNSRRQST